MDKNTWIGFLLIAAIIVGFSFINRPSKEELAERQRVQDSIAMVRLQEAEAQLLSQQIAQELESKNTDKSLKLGYNNTTYFNISGAKYQPFFAHPSPHPPTSHNLHYQNL